MKRLLRKKFNVVIVLLLLLLNVFTFTFTKAYFARASQGNEQESENLLYSYLYSGWQIIDWTMSMLDYLSHLGDKKQNLLLQFYSQFYPLQPND